VLHVVTRYLRGGSERRIVDIVSALPEARHHLAVGRDSDVDLALREVAPASLTVVGTLVREPSPWRDAVTLRRLVRLVRDHGSDLVITHQSKAGALGRTAAWLCGVPAVQSLSMASFGEGYPSWQDRVFRSIESRLAHATAAYTVVGADVRRRYAEIGVPIEKLHIVRSRVPLPPPDAALPSKAEVCTRFGLPLDRPLILYLGSLEERKNVLELPTLLGRLLASAPSPRPFLVVAGDGPLKGRLQDALDEAVLGHDAKLVGFVPDPLPLISAADVVVLLSSVEGVPQVLIQASAVETPFVAYTVDGLGELLARGASGLGVRAGDLDAAVSAVRSILTGERPIRRGPPFDPSPWTPSSNATGP